eukprot:CAMPEP_0113610724 /NCGR_PEP_ID=MMETSP0017_2-20120614/5179_1 /TAXON_ID=2856 /ORGANISM="Cylindrotheca closterium" /LENGTH=369 /DNA_ID=CAMNT_0000519631 /DNA_START=323 /DNA_END=1432 /DNA_ORIENTATION=- /assembly_acc=CAM_ASM_000147
MNLQEQLLSSIASQIMTQRSMMMNYNLPNNNQQLLGTHLTEESAQGMGLGSNHAMLALATTKKPNNGNNRAGFQQAACTRVPCQARGMSTDHNALTAYVEIPKDAVHGLHLLCSHPACRSVGVKFRYCYYCKKPVTKQNFRSRHLHADLAEKEKQKTTAPQPIMPLLPTTSASGPVCLPVSTSAPPSPPLTLQQPPKATLFGNCESTISPRSNLQSLIDAANANQKRPREEPVPNTQQRKWAALLTERPTNMMLVPGWLSKVISTSAPKNPRAPSPVPLVTSPLYKESKWNNLLLERPDGTEDGEKVNTWLVKVLEVSAPIRCKSPASLDSYEGLRQRLNSPSSLSGGTLHQPYLASDDAEPIFKKRKI